MACDGAYAITHHIITHDNERTGLRLRDLGKSFKSQRVSVSRKSERINIKTIKQ